MKRAVVLALAALMVFGVAGAALADVSAEYVGAGGPPLAVSNTTPVTVTATVNPRLTLTITTPDAGQAVAFGNVDPGVDTSAVVTVSVKSNKGWTASKGVSGDFALIGLSTTDLSTLTNYGVKGAWDFTDTYTVNPPLTTDPGVPYTADVVYTVTQI